MYRKKQFDSLTCEAYNCFFAVLFVVAVIKLPYVKASKPRTDHVTRNA